MFSKNGKRMLELFEEEISGLEWGRDLGTMSWYEASVHYECIHGWRLPTIDELKNAYNKKLEGFDEHTFWSANMIDHRRCWTLSFKGEAKIEFKLNQCHTRFCRNKN